MFGSFGLGLECHAVALGLGLIDVTVAYVLPDFFLVIVDPSCQVKFPSIEASSSFAEIPKKGFQRAQAPTR